MSLECRFFRIIEPEGSTRIHPHDEGLARSADRLLCSRPIAAFKTRPRYFRGLNFTPAENSQVCFGR